jgi:NAD(P)H-hydrate epimerase
MTIPASHCRISDRLYTCAEISKFEQQVIREHKVPAIRLMRRAATAAFELLRERYPDARKLIVFCGSGNNGGDGWVLAALAARADFKVMVVTLAEPTSLRSEAAKAYVFAQEQQVEWLRASDLDQRVHVSESAESAESPDVLVDAMLGSGLKRELSGDYRLVVEWINNAGVPVLSLDIPSGLNADTGRVMGACAVQADATISFVGQKRGMLTALGPEYSGMRYCDELELDQALSEAPPPQCEILRPRPLCARPASAHKGDHGHVVVVGGNTGTLGAGLMAATAALRVGAGLVTLATPDADTSAVSLMRPEIMTQQPRSAPELGSLLERATAMVVGPGFGQDAWAKQMLYAVSLSKLPVVLDAEALRLLARQPKMRMHSDFLLLTPHPGEAADLLEISTKEVQDDRFAAAEMMRARYGAKIVLKGSGTILCMREDHFVLCDRGNAGMGSGGMGDVLSGVIGGLLTQGDIYADAQHAQEQRVGLAVYLHSQAADDVAGHIGERGMLAGDLCERFPELLMRMQQPCGDA